MKKILMRSAMPIESDKNVSEILIYNMVGSNTGNLLYQNSIARVLMTEDTEITTLNTNRFFSDEEVERFNAEYDMFVIPLANALRISFMDCLEMLTNLVERLTIPCVVIGIGIQRNLGSKQWSYPFDEAAAAFFKAVLDRSAIVGVRGEITAEYLSRLGFVAERDFTVIGCPSMYSYGDRLPAPRVKELTPESKVAVNFKADLPPKLYKVLRRNAAQFADSTFITQVVKEIKNLYIGYPYPKKEVEKGLPEDYPIHFTNELMLQGKMVGFVDEASWVDYLKGRDFNFGSRIHGDIASILAGTPCVIFAGDCRVKELSEYHHIPHLAVSELDDGTDIFEVYQKADYGYLLKGHEERVSRYLDFLDKNKLERIDRESLNSKETPFDRLQSTWNKAGAIRAFPACSLEEQERRIQEYIRVLERKGRRERKEFLVYREEAEKKLERSRNRRRELEEELNEIKSSRFYKAKLQYDNIKKKFR